MSDQTPVEDPADMIEAELLEDPSFERLLHFLRDSRSFDFTGYKRPSLMRQVRHRMREIGIDSYEDYQDVLQLEPREFTALFNTILINVTSFFRDPDAWEQLHTEILPQVLEAAMVAHFGFGAPAAQRVRRRTQSRCCCTRKWAAASENGSRSTPLTLMRMRSTTLGRPATAGVKRVGCPSPIANGTST
jgi:hypothetical protein